MATASLLLILIISAGFPFILNAQQDDEKIIIINSDGGADDAAAILQVLGEPSANLLAITCSYGNVNMEQACDNILRVLELEGYAEEVPVFKGASKPIFGDPFLDGYFGSDGLGNSSQLFPLPKHIKAKGEHAALAIVSYINMYPGKITLISLAPLTNIALAVELDPTIPSKLKQLTMMAGSATADGNITPVSEFNAVNDPVAAQIVINTFPQGCYVTVMTWDMCVEYTPSWDWFNNWISTNTTEANFLSKIFAIANAKNKKTNETFECCDLQATSAVLYPEIVNDTDPEYVRVEICGYLTRGEFVVDYRNQPAKAPNVYFYSALNMQTMLDTWTEITSTDSDNSTVLYDTTTDFGSDENVTDITTDLNYDSTNFNSTDISDTVFDFSAENSTTEIFNVTTTESA